MELPSLCNGCTGPHGTTGNNGADWTTGANGFGEYRTDRAYGSYRTPGHNRSNRPSRPDRIGIYNNRPNRTSGYNRPDRPSGTYGNGINYYWADGAGVHDYRPHGSDGTGGRYRPAR